MTCAKAEDRLKCLKERHAELKRMIDKLQHSGWLIVSIDRLRKLKKQKLRIKDEIARLESALKVAA
jgi:uncharacterized protein YdcH (DUF465 family)